MEILYFLCTDRNLRLLLQNVQRCKHTYKELIALKLFLKLQNSPNADVERKYDRNYKNERNETYGE